MKNIFSINQLINLQKFYLFSLILLTTVFISSCAKKDIDFTQSIDIQLLASDPDFQKFVNLANETSKEKALARERSSKSLINTLNERYSLKQFEEEEINDIVYEALNIGIGAQGVGVSSSGNAVEDVSVCELGCATAYLACLLAGAEFCYDNYQLCLLLCRTQIDPPF
jgi:hypothetical protein